MRSRLGAASALLAPLLLVLAACVSTRRPLARPPEPLPAPAAGTLRVATFNVYGIPVVTPDCSDRMHRLPDALRSLTADVICLQEVFDDGVRDGLAWRLGPEWQATRSRHGGLLILSRVPFRDERFLGFPNFAGLDLAERIAGKGMLAVTVDAPGGPVRVVTTHLALDLEDEGPKRRQLAWLLERLAGTRDLPVVLAGDFNLMPGHEAWDLLGASGFRTAGRRDPASGAAIPPTPPTRVGWPRTADGLRGWWPDHVVFRAGGGRGVEPVGQRLALDDPADAISDHNALVADLRIVPAAQAPAR